jgi:CMP-N-acetylneuraminic acid synthetase
MESDCDALVSVQKVPVEYNPHWTFKVNEEGFLNLTTNDEQIITRRQDLPTIYHRDGLVYITKTSVLLKQNSIYGNKIAYIESPEEGQFNIDTMDDWHKAEAYLKSKQK